MRQPASPFNVIYVNGLSCLFDKQQFARLTSMMHIRLIEARLWRGQTMGIWNRLRTLSVVAIGRNSRWFMLILLWREAGRPIQMSIQIERPLCSLVNSIGNKIGLIRLMLPWEIRTKQSCMEMARMTAILSERFKWRMMNHDILAQGSIEHMPFSDGKQHF